MQVHPLEYLHLLMLGPLGNLFLLLLLDLLEDLDPLPLGLDLLDLKVLAERLDLSRMNLSVDLGLQDLDLSNFFKIVIFNYYFI